MEAMSSQFCVAPEPLHASVIERCHVAAVSSGSMEGVMEGFPRAGRKKRR